MAVSISRADRILLFPHLEKTLGAQSRELGILAGRIAAYRYCFFYNDTSLDRACAPVSFGSRIPIHDFHDPGTEPLLNTRYPYRNGLARHFGGLFWGFRSAAFRYCPKCPNRILRRERRRARTGLAGTASAHR